MEPFEVQMARGRVGLGWTQQHLADLAGISRNTVAQIEGGHATPTLRTVHAIVRAFERAGVTVVLNEPVSTGKVGAPVNRREFFRTSAAVVPSILALSTARSESPHGLSEALVTTYEQQLAQAARDRAIQPPRELLPELTNRLHILTARTTERAGPDALQRRLVAVSAGTHALAAWVSLMLEHRTEARFFLDEAELLAAEVDDREALALVLMLRADLMSPVQTGGLQGSAAAARRELDRAIAIVPRTAAITIRAPLYLRAAEEAAVAGDADESDRLLEMGDEIAATGAVIEHRLRPFWAPWAVDSWRGSCAALLGRPEAVDILQRFRSTFPCHRPLQTADIGAALARQGEIDAAAAALVEAIDEAEEHGHAAALARINGTIRRHLEPRWSKEPTVRRLTDRLAGIL